MKGKSNSQQRSADEDNKFFYQHQQYLQYQQQQDELEGNYSNSNSQLEQKKSGPPSDWHVGFHRAQQGTEVSFAEEHQRQMSCIDQMRDIQMDMLIEESGLG